MINVFQPSVGDEEVDAIRAVFNTSWLGKGPQVAAFEVEFAEYLGTRAGSIATSNSCTEAMFQILDLIKKPSGSVVLPTISFVGAANAILASGMHIQFADVDPDTGNPNLEHIISAADESTVAVLVQHFGGIPCDIQAIAEWCRTNHVLLIEDSAGSIATRVGERACGTFGDFGVWSFDAMKMVVAGDGGAIYASDLDSLNQLRERMYMGMSAVSGSAQAAVNDRWWEFDVSFAGRRSIMNDVGAAMGRVQLRKLPENLNRRARNSELYFSGLRNLGHCVALPSPSVEEISLSHYFFPIRLKQCDRDPLAHHLRNKSVYTTFRYYPLHKVELYQSQAQVLRGADEFSETTLLLPQHASLSDSDIDYVVEQIHEFFCD